MFSYTKKSLYILTSIITVCVFCLIEYSVIKITLPKEEIIKDNIPITNENAIPFVEGIIITLSNVRTIDEEIWQLEIPNINLKADIAEGTTQEILKNNIGHFEETPILKGNVCLASHNRGSSGYFFARIKELELGDEIIYRAKGQEINYKVLLKTIIKETDLSYIENTKDDRITLITCVEDMPELRRCIQGVKI